LAISRIDYIKKSLAVRKTRVFCGQIDNPDDGGEIEKKAKKDRALGKKNSKDSKSHLSGIKI